MLQFLQKIIKYFVAFAGTNNNDELNCYKQIYSTYGIQFVKTIRSDSDDYHDELIEAITGGPKKSLRREKTFKDRYKIGIRDQQVTILRKDQSRKFLPPQFSAEEKEGKSKKMSFSVISSKQRYLTDIFGGDNEWRKTGIIIFTESGGECEEDKQIILPSLIFKKDSGTVGRTYYFDNEDQANQYIRDKGLYVNVQQLITTQLQNRDARYNEVLSRCQWIPDDPRCHMFICSTDLKSKLLVQLRAIDFKIKTKANYIPITFYNKNNENCPFNGYLLENRQADVDAGLLLSADNNENHIINSMALLIKKYTESQSSNNVIFSDEEKEKCLTILLKFKFTKTTTIAFLKLIYANNRADDINCIVGIMCDLLNNSQDINFSFIIYSLEYMQNIEKKVFLEKFLEKITHLRPKITKQLMQFINSFDNEDIKFNYFGQLLNKISDSTNLQVIQILVDVASLFKSHDVKLNYLVQLLNKMPELTSPDIIAELVTVVKFFYNIGDIKKLNYLSHLLNKISDFTNPGVIKELVHAVNFLINEKYMQLSYLEQLLNKISDFSNLDIIKELLKVAYLIYNNDIKLNYLGQLLNKISNLTNPDVIKKLVDAVYRLQAEDVRLNYLKQLLNKLVDVDYNAIEMFLMRLYHSKLDLKNNMQILKKFKLSDVLQVIREMKEKICNLDMDHTQQEKIQTFLDTVTTNLITMKLTSSPLLITFVPVSSSSSNINENTASNDEPAAKRRKY